MKICDRHSSCPQCGNIDACRWGFFNPHKGCKVDKSHIHKKCHGCKHEWVELMQKEELDWAVKEGLLQKEKK